MQIRVSTKDGIPLYQQIKNQIKYLIASGRLSAGEQLPPVRKLAEHLVINPNTAARAYRELESEGVLHTRQGSGVFVAEGISPLAKREQTKILYDRIDMLLAEALQMKISTEEVIDMLQKRSRLLKS